MTDASRKSSLTSTGDRRGQTVHDGKYIPADHFYQRFQHIHLELGPSGVAIYLVILLFTVGQGQGQMDDFESITGCNVLHSLLLAAVGPLAAARRLEGRSRLRPFRTSFPQEGPLACCLLIERRDGCIDFAIQILARAFLSAMLDRLDSHQTSAISSSFEPQKHTQTAACIWLEIHTRY